MSDSRAPEVRDLGQVTFHIEGPLGIVTLNRPEVLNAQGYELLAQVDQAFDLAQADQAIRVVIVRGAGGMFSAGHDLSPGQQRGDDPLERYNEFKKYNLDLLLTRVSELGIMQCFALQPWAAETGSGFRGAVRRTGWGFGWFWSRRAGWKVHGTGGVPPVVTGAASFVRDRELRRLPGSCWWGTTVAAACACVKLLF